MAAEKSVFWPGSMPLPPGTYPPGVPFGPSGPPVGSQEWDQYRQAPARFDRTKMEENETGTWPPPLQLETRGHWAHGPDPAQWVAVGSGGVVARTIWTSPIFDFRPDLKTSDGYVPDNVVPIFRGAAYGAGARLALKVKGAINTLLVDLRVVSLEFSDPIDSRAMDQTQTPQDITADFMDGADSVVLLWSPPGSPIRHWQVRMIIDQLTGAFPVDTPQFTMSAGVY